MPKRRKMTAADYAAMAICPSLIVLMLAALMHFVILCLYRGPYPARLTYILFMFIMGATGIARISIEFGRSYASLYAGALGLAVILVLGPFAVFPVALIWFLADRITFDCTVIDDGKDASGEGLIESGGLFGGKRPTESRDVSLDGTTDRVGEVGESGDAQSDSGGATAATRRKRRKTHKPGKTVFYLALAALPLFGLGQFLLPPQESVRDQAAVAMGLYLFATLTLLVVTSFLGLRRYLRQRGAEMPADVSVAWVAGGAVLTAVMLIACFALPLPGHMLAVAEIPTIESPDWFTASRFGWGNEGVENGDEANDDVAKVTDPSSDQPPGADTDGQRDAQSQESGGQGQSSSSQSNAGQQPSGQSQSGQSESGENQRRQSPSGDDPSGGSESGQSQASQSESNQSESSQSESGRDSPREGEAPSNGDQQSGSESGRSTSAERSAEQDARADGERSSDETTSESEGQAGQPGSDGENSTDHRREQPTEEPSGSSAESTRESGEATSEQNSSTSDYSPPSLPNFLSGVGTLLKFLVVLILIGIIVIFLLKNPQLWRQWLDALAALFRSPEKSGDAGDAEEPGPLAPVSYRSFRSFSNPLSEGGDPRRAIVVTFQALDAWAREQGYPRHEDETPAEFATRLAKHHPAVSEDLPRLADAYNRIVYGRSKATKRDMQAASSAWQLMTSAPRETPAV